MNTTPSKTPVASELPQDLKFNAGKIDEFVTSMGWTYTDRFGNKHYTIEGINYLAQQVMNAFGYITLTGVDFDTGATVSTPNEVLFNPADNSYYKWTGSFVVGGKVVPENSTPESTGGIGPGKWLSVGDTVLRKDLASSTAGKGASLVTLESGENVEEAIDANRSASYRDRCITKLANVDYKVRNRIGISVLFQGDSMTAGYDVVTTDSVPAEAGDWARHATTTYPERFASYLAEQSGCAVIPTIRAISGHTAKQAYEQPEWQTNPNCDVVFLMYALNDASGTAGATHEIYIEYMEKLIKRFIDWGMGVVVLSCANGGYGSKDQKAQSYAREIKNMAVVYGCAHFNANEVQYNRIFGAVQSDGGHFNSNGYARLGDAVASMIMAGGLLPNYRPVSSEISIWPGIESDQVAYCDARNNIDLGRLPAAAYTLQSIIGAMPANAFSLMSFSFYLDAESASVDVVGSWESSSKLSIIVQQKTSSEAGATVPYYDPATYNSSKTKNTKSNISGVAVVTAYANSGVSKQIGIIGRGWKTITMYTPQDGSGTAPAYIQGINITPIPSYLASRDSNGSTRRGIKEVIALSLPYRDFHPSGGGVPSPYTLNSEVIPLPYDMNAVSWDNGGNFFDCGAAKLIITGNQTGESVVYYEALITKNAIGNNVVVTELKKVGTMASIVATIGTKPKVVITAKDSVGANMPLEAIYGIGGNASFTPSTTPNENGLFIKLAFTWPGAAPTGYYNIYLESFAQGLGGAASNAIQY